MQRAAAAHVEGCRCQGGRGGGGGARGGAGAGRTGRGGKTGTAHTFFTVNDKAHSGELINVLREAGAPIPEEMLKRFGATVKKKVSNVYGAYCAPSGAAGGPPMPSKGTKMTFD